MEHNEVTNANATAIARLEAQVQGMFDRQNLFESRVDKRLYNIETKLDALWWKLGVMVGVLVGAGQVASNLL